MPNDMTLWLVVAILVAVVVAFALWRGFNVDLRKGDVLASFRRTATIPESKGTSVGRRADLDKARTGDITGEDIVAGPGEPAASGQVDVLDGARMTGARTGDITGRRIRRS